MALLLLLLLIVVFFFSFLFIATGTGVFSRWKEEEGKLRLPPSPPRLPIVGHLHLLGPLPHRSLRDLSKKHGDLMHLQLGQVPALVVSSASAARQVLKTLCPSFAGRPKRHLIKTVSYNFRTVSFAPYGDYWRRARKVSVLHLLSVKRVQSFRPVREAMVASLLSKVSSASGTVNLTELLSSAMVNLISKVALGKSGIEKVESIELHDCLVKVSGLLGNYFMVEYFPSVGWLTWLTGLDARINSAFTRLDAFMDGVLEERTTADAAARQNSAPDLVEVLLQLHQQREGEDGNPVDFELSREDVKALILNMFAAGVGTSATFLEWAMSELIRSPNAMARLQEEIREMAAGKAVVGEEELKRMPYMKMVIKEVLRLHPPVPLLLPHESIRQTDLHQGYRIPAGTTVLVNAWAIARDPDVWDDPEAFKPERFADSSVDYTGQDFELIPFGSGRRICPGMNFAETTIAVLLANLLRSFDWKIPRHTTPDELSMEEATGLVTRRKHSLILIAEPPPSSPLSLRH